MSGILNKWMEKSVIGMREKVKVCDKAVVARIDTGATISSMDSKLASQLELGPVVRTATVVSSHGKQVRPVVKIPLKIAGRKIRASFNITDRSHMKYKVLIGRNILKKGFLIDTTK